MSQPVSQCPAAMPAEMLAAWHDNALDAAATERVRAHVAGCRACQAYLAEYQANIRRLRRFDAPEMGPRVWQGVQSRIARSRRPLSRARALWAGCGAVVAVIALVALFATVLSNAGGSHPISVTPTRAATTTAVPTRTATPHPSLPWQAVPAISFAGSLQFAASPPAIGYACGTTNKSAGNHAIMLSVTRDGGQTWQSPAATPATGAICGVTVSPLNPRDIVMLIYPYCTGECFSYGPVVDYRSLDGGRSWTLLAMPTNLGQYWYLDDPVWLGTRMYLTVAYARTVPFAQRPSHTIAVSASGGPLAWVNESTLYAGATDPSVIASYEYVIGSTLYVILTGTGCGNSGPCNTPSLVIAATSDNGATWNHVHPRGTVPTNTIELAADGKTLLGIGSDSLTYDVSIDAGQTWNSIPAPVISSGFALQPIESTPDGTYFTWNPNGVYTLPPGGNAWALAAPATTPDRYDLSLTAVSWDANGHPADLWAFGGNVANGGSSPSVIFRRVP